MAASGLAEELIRTLQEQVADGAELVTFTVVLKKDYDAYVVTHDNCNYIYVERVF